MKKLPEDTKSIWAGTTPDTDYPGLSENMTTDVVVVGGGMAGVNIAYFLKNQGLKVIVLEAGRIGKGTSGNTTAKITSLHELKYAYLIKKFGKEKAQNYADSHQWAISEYRRIIEKEKIDCDLYKAPSLTYTVSVDDFQDIRREIKACLELGLPASFTNNIQGTNLKILGAVKFSDQAYFHPRKYLLKIASLVNINESYIRENTPALDIKETGTYCQVITPKAKIKAKFVVVATNFPFYDPDKIFSKLKNARSFVVASTPSSAYPDAVFIGTKSGDLSFRPHKDGKKEWLITGERHDEMGIVKNIDKNFERVANLAVNNFQVKSIDYKWGASDTMSEDDVPYIGRLPRTKNIFVATGFSTWGMTTSLVAAELISDLILGHKNEWESLYNPERIVSK